jgi:hypothetical protein
MRAQQTAAASNAGPAALLAAPEGSAGLSELAGPGSLHSPARAGGGPFRPESPVLVEEASLVQTPAYPDSHLSAATGCRNRGSAALHERSMTMKNRQQSEIIRNASGSSPPESKTLPEAALRKRINRKLAHENQVMRKARTWTTDLGWYYVVDCQSGGVESAHHDDIAAFAHDEGLVRPGERIRVSTISTEAR